MNMSTLVQTKEGVSEICWMDNWRVVLRSLMKSEKLPNDIINDVFYLDSQKVDLEETKGQLEGDWELTWRRSRVGSNEESRVHKSNMLLLLLVCVLFSLVWKHVCWGKGIGRTIWKKEIRKGIVKRERERHFTNKKFPRRGIDTCWFGESVTWTSMLNLKHQNQLCCFVAICKEHRAPVHPSGGWEASLHRVSNDRKDVWKIIKSDQNKQNRFPLILKK